jgi:hypothetical protein
MLATRTTLGIAFAACAAAGLPVVIATHTGAAPSSVEPKEEIAMASSSSTLRKIPPIDAAVPANLETATFALG